jgi:hypothetical protein
MPNKSKAQKGDGLSRFEHAKGLAHAFSDVRLKPICAEMSGVLANCKSIQIGEDRTNFSYYGFQLGDCGTDFVQLLIEFNSTELTLRALACFNSARVFSAEKVYAISSSVDGSEGHPEWDEKSAASWMDSTAKQAARAFLQAGDETVR